MVNQKTEDFILGALLGGVVAAATTLLFTPTSGTKLREHVRNGLNLIQSRRASRRPSRRSASLTIRASRSRAKGKSRSSRSRRAAVTHSHHA